MHVSRRSSHPSTNRSHCVNIQEPRLYNTEVRTAPRTAMPAVPSPALPQTTCRVQLQSVTSTVSKLLERIPNTCACGTQPCPDLRGREPIETRSKISPVWKKTVQHRHVPTLFASSLKGILQGAARRPRSPTWRGRETHGCEIAHRRLRNLMGATAS